MTDINASAQKVHQIQLRTLVAAGFILICFLLLITRLYYLQVVRHAYFHTRAEDNRIALLPVVPNRGIITDRNGNELARNYAAYTLEIIPSKARDIDTLLEELSQIVTIEPRDQRRFLRAVEESRNFPTVPLRMRLSDEEVARFIAERYRFPEVELQARFFRDYPYGAATAHVVGYIGRINDQDLERIQEREETANYRGSEYIGKNGLELSYESHLHGKTGNEQVEVNAAGYAVRRLSHTPAQNGNNLQLALDIALQQVATAAFGNRRGALVAMDPATGGILALVSTPTYDPNLFVEGISVPDWKALNESPDHPLLNRAIYSAYPPGSTFKPFMALAGLSSGKRTAEEEIADSGIFQLGNRTFLDDKYGGHGRVDMHKSLVVSCNTYYYQLANDLGIAEIHAFMAPLGLGSRTGVDMPGETTGVLPSPEWKKRRFSNPQDQRWQGGDTVLVGIGQGYNAFTPIQMTSALATLVNGGKVFQPHLVKEIVDSRTGEAWPVAAHPVRTLSFDPAHVAAVRAAMVDVIKTGTGARAFAGAEYQAGGKTGTAQIYTQRGGRYVERDVQERLRDHSWFIAFAPADKPSIVLAVVVENGGFGSRSAAPIARQVLDFYLLGVHPEQPAPEDTAARENMD